MSFNSWLYGNMNPINYIDPSGQMPLECDHINNRYLARCATLAARSENPENYPSNIAPPGISWNPSVNVNLATDLDQNTQHAEENKGVTFMGYGLCGQIALEMVLETITGTPNLLNEIWNSTSPTQMGEKTESWNLEPAVLAILKKHAGAQASNWRVTTYSYQQILTHTSYGDYYEQNNQGQWYGDEKGSLIASRFRHMLQLNHYVIVLSTMKQDTHLTANPWGTLTNDNSHGPTAGHWVALTGMSSSWDDINEDSPGNWVRINNTYSNQEQYYPWKFFKDSMFAYNGPNTHSSPYVMEIWHR
jgi:hypothetical protein